MPSDEDPAKANYSKPQSEQTAVSNVTARYIQIRDIVQTIQTSVNLGLPLNRRHLRFVQFLANSTYLTCLIGGFIRLWQNGADEISLLLLIVGSGLLSLTCLYYAWFWKPEVQDKSAPSSEPPNSDERVRTQRNKQRSRQRVRRLAMVGVFAIPLLTCAGFFVWRSLPAPYVLLLIADFDGVEQQNYQVTENILRNLRNDTEPYADVKVQALSQTITEQQGSKFARDVGEWRKASIVIWGSYGVTSTNVQDSVHFEVLKPLDDFPKLEKTARGEAQTLALSELNSFKLQTRLSNEISYLTLFTLGMLQYAKEDWDGAVIRFKSALDQLKEPVTTLGQEAVYFYLGSAHSNKSDYKNAVADYTKVLKLKPNYAEAYHNRGVTHLKQGEYTQALADFKSALKLKPNYADAYYGRGLAYSSLGKYSQAINDYNKTLKLKPKYADVYHSRGRAYSKQGNYPQAITDYTKALKLKPDDANIYHNRGLAYLKQGKYPQAIADYTKALKLKPKYAAAYHGRGLAYSSLGKYPQAIDDYNQTLQLKPSYAAAHNDRGLAYLKQGNHTQALADFNSALKLKPGYAAAYYGRGLAHSSLGKYPQAIADYNYALKLKPNYADIYNSRGRAYSKQGNYTQAIADYNYALKLKPDSAASYYNKARIYSLNTEVKAANENLQRAIDLDAKYREKAKIDSDLDNIREDKQFRVLVGQ